MLLGLKLLWMADHVTSKTTISEWVCNATAHATDRATSGAAWLHEPHHCADFRHSGTGTPTHTPLHAPHAFSAHQQAPPACSGDPSAQLLLQLPHGRWVGEGTHSRTDPCLSIDKFSRFIAPLIRRHLHHSTNVGRPAACVSTACGHGAHTHASPWHTHAYLSMAHTPSSLPSPSPLLTH